MACCCRRPGRSTVVGSAPELESVWELAGQGAACWGGRGVLRGAGGWGWGGGVGPGLGVGVEPGGEEAVSIGTGFFTPSKKSPEVVSAFSFPPQPPKKKTNPSAAFPSWEKNS